MGMNVGRSMRWNIPFDMTGDLVIVVTWMERLSYWLGRLGMTVHCGIDHGRRWIATNMTMIEGSRQSSRLLFGRTVRESLWWRLGRIRTMENGRRRLSFSKVTTAMIGTLTV